MKNNLKCKRSGGEDREKKKWINEKARGRDVHKSEKDHGTRWRN
jgi:hypothetical protein